MRARVLIPALCLMAGAAMGAGVVWWLRPAALPPASPIHNPLDRAFVSLADTSEDLARYQALTHMDDPKYLATVLQKIFADGIPESPEAKALRIAAYVAQTTKMKFTATPSGTVVLQQGFAFCNGMALAFVSLCKQAGLPARINALHNIGWMEAHNMAEVHYDGAWHCFDPTYGTLFYTAPTYPGEGRVVSLRELMASPGAYHCIQFASELWTGEYSPTAPPQPLDPAAKYGNWSFTLAEFYGHALRTAFPIIYDVEQTVSYPIAIDLREQREVWIGKKDGDLMDMLGKQEGKYPRHHGVPYLGPVRLGNAFHTLTLRVPEPGAYRITYHFGPQSAFEDIAPMEIADVAVRAYGPSGDSWSVEFSAQSANPCLVLVNRAGSAYVDAIHAERIQTD
jgi:Transglutaminase-like superfamily